MAGPPDSEAQKIMGARLQAIREALGLTQEDLASTMGVVTTALSAWESGRNKIDIVKLARAATRWGFTTDWVARADMSGLRRDLADKLEALATKEPAPRRGRPPIRSKGPAPPDPILGESVAKNASSKDSRKIVPLLRRVPASA